ncbi:chromosome segregation SMC family protein [Thermaurantiacus sp.]
MQFERLRLVGFKSFVEPTELAILPGLTGIVGPNGCGKSNLLEALRWVMGESSAKSLRGGSAATGGGMEDVIFAGTAKRPARNFAEVALSLDNRDRRAPAAFNGEDRLEVVRRIERGSGSDYRINAREVRQRDVQMLFADAATGAHSPALVSQGRVAALIAARPDERRQLLEDAAGVSGLAVRRREAEIRLKAADSNLGRLAEIVAAGEAQASTLRRQARAAERYRDLSSRIRAAEAASVRLAFLDASARAEAAEADVRKAEAELAAAEEAEAVLRTAQASKAAALPGLRQAEAEAAARLQAILTARATLVAERVAAEQRQRDLAAALAAARAERSEAERRRADSHTTGARLEAERTAAMAEAADAEAAAGPAAADVTHCEALAAEAEQALAEAVAAHAAIVAEARAVRAAADAARSRLARVAGERDRQLAALKRLDAEGSTGAADQRVSAAAEAAARAADATAAARTRVAEAAAARRAAEEARAAIEVALAAARAEVRGLEAEKDALRRLSGDASKPARSLYLEAEAGYEAALAAALGDDADAEAGPADAGSPPARRWAGAPITPDDPPLPPGVAPLAPHVAAPPQLARRLAQVGLVTEVPAAALLAALKPGQRLVSREGFLWRWDGFEAPPGGRSAAVAETLRQANRLAEIETALPAPRARCAEAEAELACQRDRVAAAVAAERAAVAAEAAAQRAQADAEARLQGARNAAAESHARRSAIAASVERLTVEAESAAEDAAAAAVKVSELPDASAAAEAVGDARLAAERARADLARARAHLAALVRTAAEERARAAGLAREMEAWEARAGEALEAMDRLAGRIEQLDSEHAALVGTPAAMTARLQAIEAELAAAEAARSAAGDAVLAADLELADLDRAARSAAARVADLREARGAATAAAAAAQDRLQRLVSEAGGEPEAPADCPDEAALAARARELPALVAERERMGPVNLVAAEELANLEADLTRKRAEKAELETAVARLRASIGVLNREARARLTEAFSAVDRAFRELFQTLFDGGSAELGFVDSDDPLEAGLEIRAQPPGKKLQSLSLLSGGEQALTAIALIFALFRTRPAPICVLDEVDAPLDDANVERFCRLLAHMAETTATRFLIVTHNMISMAAMHRLYGVTMAEPGVSQLVSVELAAAGDLLAA